MLSICALLFAIVCAVSARNQLCDNPLLVNVTDGLCTDKLAPYLFIAMVDVAVGPKSQLCRAFACALDQFDCETEKSNVEKIITGAGGQLKPCGSNYGLDSNVCNALGSFIYNTNVPDPNANLTTLAKSVSLCSPLIGAVLRSPKFAMYAEFASYFGPCSSTCAYGACGLNIVCPEAAAAPLKFIADYDQNSGCPANSTNSCDSLMLPDPSHPFHSQNDGTSVAPGTYGSNHHHEGSDSTAVAGSCEALQSNPNGTCEMCHSIANDCLWCSKMRRCVSGGGWFGAGDALKNATDNLFNFDQDCGDWQYGQCAMQGRVLVYVGFGGIGLLVLIIVGVAICCCCMCRARRQKSKSYSLLLNNDDKGNEDGVALLQNEDTRE